MNKQLLRQALREKRRLLDTTVHQQLSARIAANLMNNPVFQNSQEIACYLPNDHEVDTRIIIDSIWQHAKNCYLPLINPEAKTLQFALYTKECCLSENQYGILEPRKTPIVAAGDLDLMIAPLVGFDCNKHRLGMGGGFYDRTLANCDSKKPLFLGLAFTCQRVDELPNEQHDARLDFIVTELR